MKLKFRATRELKSYEATDVFAYDGGIVDVAPHRGMQLLKVYPDNFLEIEPPAPKKRSPRPQRQENMPPPAPSSEEYRPPLRAPLTLADITVVVINPYPEIFRTHFLPCIPKEVEFIPLENIDNIYWTSGAKALNWGIKVASNDIVMCAHPDLILGKHWWENFIYHEARLESWGALGVVGWDFNNTVTWGNDFLSSRKVQCLDENCVIVNRKNNIWFDETKFPSWHCFAADFCLQCYDKGLDAYVVPGVSNHVGYSFANVDGFMKDRDDTLPILWQKWKDKVSRINMGLPEKKFRGQI